MPIDVDECDEKIDGCTPETEVCRNTLGGYECDIRCRDGFDYSIVTRSCIGESVDVLSPHSIDTRSCIGESVDVLSPHSIVTRSCIGESVDVLSPHSIVTKSFIIELN